MEEATEVLLALAGRNRPAVERAMLRIRRGLDARPSRVGEQAVASLELVLARISSDDAAVLVVGSRVV